MQRNPEVGVVNLVSTAGHCCYCSPAHYISLKILQAFNPRICWFMEEGCCSTGTAIQIKVKKMGGKECQTPSFPLISEKNAFPESAPIASQDKLVRFVQVFDLNCVTLSTLSGLKSSKLRN